MCMHKMFFKCKFSDFFVVLCRLCCTTGEIKKQIQKSSYILMNFCNIPSSFRIQQIKQSLQTSENLFKNVRSDQSCRIFYNFGNGQIFSYKKDC